MRITASSIAILTSLWGCEPSHEDVREDLHDTDARLSLAKAPALEHGAVWFGARVETDFGAQALHAWTFDLAQPASVRLETEASATGPDLDTIVYLYRHGEAGWGAYLARNDNRPGSGFSTLARKLAPGRYRLVVKGPKAEANSFVLAAWCDGEGCNVPVQPPDCALGRKLADLSGLLSLSTVITMQGRAPALDKWLPRQIVAAARHAPVPRVETTAQLFRLADSGLVRWFRSWDYAAGRDFRGIEFKLGGRSYGAMFPPAAADPVAVVEDGALRACSVPVVRCALGTTYHELRENPAYTLRSSQVISLANVAELSAEEQAQLLAAVQVAYEEAADLETALASVDQGEVNQLWFVPRAGGPEIVAYEYGAGDNSYGGIFVHGSVELEARINDGDLIDCRLLE
jgi:hypothetical protein